MTTPEVEEILRIGSETSGMTFADGSAERIANYAGGSPYVARLICLYAASMANADRQTSISLDHINRGAERVVQEWHERIDRKSTRLNSSHSCATRMPSTA